MNTNLLNNKRERTTKEQKEKEIIVTLEKSGINSYKYLSDTLNDREKEKTKIKIPLLEDSKIIQQEKIQQEKILQKKNLTPNKINQNQNQINTNSLIPPQEKEKEKKLENEE